MGHRDIRVDLLEDLQQELPEEEMHQDVEEVVAKVFQQRAGKDEIGRLMFLTTFAIVVSKILEALNFRECLAQRVAADGDLLNSLLFTVGLQVITILVMALDKYLMKKTHKNVSLVYMIRFALWKTILTCVLIDLIFNLKLFVDLFLLKNVRIDLYVKGEDGEDVVSAVISALRKSTPTTTAKIYNKNTTTAIPKNNLETTLSPVFSYEEDGPLVVLF